MAKEINQPTIALRSDEFVQRHSVSAAGYLDDPIHLLVDSVRDYAIYMLDTSGNIVTWNAGAEQLTGYSADEAIGQHVSLLYPPEDKTTGKAADELRQAIDEGRYEEEGWRMRKNGTRFWANVVLTPVFNEQRALKGFAKVTRDFTERRQLSQSEERFKLLVESVKDYAIFMLDENGFVQSWNLGASRLKGYTEQEIVGRHFSTFYTDEDRARNHPQEELEIAIREGRYEEEGWRVRKDGSRFWANVVITAVFEGDGTLRGFAKVTRDMSQRREMEENLRDLNRQLESFAYSVSHDLRAPLRNVAFTSKMLLEDYQDKLDEEGKDLLEVQVSSTTKLAAVIDDLLTLSRLSRMEVKKEKLDISEVAKTVVKEVLSKTAREIEPTIEIEPGLKGMADPTLLRVVLLNLVDNAIKFSPNGGTITIGKHAVDGKTEFFVRDEGMGLDMEYAHKIFLPFERLVTDAHSSGSGIGLANVQQAVLRNGGRIRVESTPGKGTTFYFTLG